MLIYSSIVGFGSMFFFGEKIKGYVLHMLVNKKKTM